MRNLQLKWLRKQMGLVNQEPALFAATIADNVLHGKEDADMEQVIEAAKAANAHFFIQSLPDGYQTQVVINHVVRVMTLNFVGLRPIEMILIC